MLQTPSIVLSQLFYYCSIIIHKGLSILMLGLLSETLQICLRYTPKQCLFATIALYKGIAFNFILEFAVLILVVLVVFKEHQRNFTVGDIVIACTVWSHQFHNCRSVKKCRFRRFQQVPGIQQHDSGPGSLWNLFLVAHWLFS